MALGIRDDQNDIDVRDPTTRANKNEEERLRQSYQPRQNGEVVDRRTGNPAPDQLYPFDSLYTDTEISFDKIWENNDDYKLATETAGHANISVEVFIVQNNVEHQRAVSAHQRDLLVEERKKRLVSFAARNNELREIQKSRKEIENVMSRLHDMYRGILPTIKRWYWLGTFTGTLPQAAGMKDPSIVPISNQTPIPFWLMTEYVRWQYVHLSEKKLFESDTLIWAEARPATAWTQWYLRKVPELFDTVLSLTDEQRQFGSCVYLILRDGVFANLLKVVEPTDSSGTIKNPPHIYKDVFSVVEQIRSRIKKTISKEAIRKEAVTYTELDSTMIEEDIEMLTAKKLIKEEELLENLGDTLFRNQVMSLFEKRNASGEAFPFTTFLTSDEDAIAIAKEFFDEGFMLGLINLAKSLDGISTSGLMAWIYLLSNSVASTSIPAANSRFQEEMVSTDVRLFTAENGAKISISFGAAVPIENRFANMFYAVFWGPPPDNKTTLTHESNGRMLTETFAVLHEGAVILSITFSNLTPIVLKGIKELKESGAALADAILANFHDPASVPTQRWKFDITRQILTLVFWSLVMRDKTFFGLFTSSLGAFGYNRSDGEVMETRKTFMQKNFFIKHALDETVDTLAALRGELGVPLHFYRELFRTLFIDEFERTKIDAALRVTKTDQNKLEFLDDVKANVLTMTPKETKNDAVFQSTWDKLYDNFFLPNPEEYEDGVADKNLKDLSTPYWRGSVLQSLARKKKDSVDGAFSFLWNFILSDQRYTTQRMRFSDGISPQDVMLNITKTGETETQVGNIEKYGFNVEVEKMLGHWKTRLISEQMRIQLPDQSVTAAVPPMTIFHALIIFTQTYYPKTIASLRKQLEKADETLAGMVRILQASLTNNPQLALDELKQLAHETYLPDSRYHNQSKYTGRLVFTALFIAATHAAYADLQHLAHLPPPPEFNMYGKRPRIVPVNYSHLRAVPLDVLSANTNPVNDASGAPTRDYIDMTTTSTSTSTLMMLRSGMGAMIAQHIFGIRLNAPDEYKSVIQHKRAPGELAAAQKAMAKFRFSKTGKPRGWTVTIEY
jgi:hypothetical protein